MRHCRPSIRQALPHTGDHIRGCTGQQYAECSDEHTVKASASTPYSLPNARAGSLL